MAKKKEASNKGKASRRLETKHTVRETDLLHEEDAEGSVAAPVVGETKTEKKERPVRCIRRHTDLEFRREFRHVCEGLIEKAKGGGVRETRLLLDIGQFGDAKAAKRRGAKSLSTMLLDELKRRQDEREAAIDGAAACDAVAAAKISENNEVEAAIDGDAKER